MKRGLQASVYWCSHTLMQDGAAKKIHLQLNPDLPVPLYRQIMDGVKELIAADLLKPGDQLPSIRDLASELRINPSSAVKAYGELRHEGIIDMDQGRGTFVSEDARVSSLSREGLLESALSSLLLKARTWGFTTREVVDALERCDAALTRSRKTRRS
jgi:GntR family transcriptional regulator